jgi:hypothetical protein
MTATAVWIIQKSENYLFGKCKGRSRKIIIVQAVSYFYVTFVFASSSGVMSRVIGEVPCT